MTLSKRQILVLTVILTVFIVKFFSEQVNNFLWDDIIINSFYLSVLGQIFYYVIPTVAVLLIFHRLNKIISELGLNKDFIRGLKYAFIITLPMLIGYFLLGHFNEKYSLIRNIAFAFKDGFREEVFYRAFLFGQLFRRAKFGFLPSVGINGLVFGFSHLYQAHTITESIGIFAITFAGAIWFAWLFIEWKENLWLPIFIHFFMNIYWEMFSTEKTAIGGLILNLPRVLTIAFSIFLTIKIIRGKEKLKINKTNLLYQKEI